jgi:hypothetical protein
MNLPDKILVRPAMRLWLFLKKHPWASLIIGLLLFLLPPLGIMIYALSAKLATTVGRVLGEKIGESFSNFVQSVTSKLVDTAWVWLVPVAFGLVLPPLGVLFGAWLLIDFFKGERVTTVTTTTVKPAETTSVVTVAEDVFESFEEDLTSLTA